MMNLIKKIGLASVLILAFGLTANAATPVSLEELLQSVKSGRVKDAAENKSRMDAFRADRAQQTKKLNAMKAEQKRQERLSAQMEKQFEVNDSKIIDLERAFQERLGGLKELFGVLQQASGDARAQFEASMTQVQFPDRTAFLLDFAKKMGQSNRLASLEEIERLWFELQREMTETGKVVTFKTKVISADGEEGQQDVTRIGAFNVVSDDDKYLEYVPETGRLVELQRQPQSRYTSRIGDLVNATSDMHPLGIDPTRGQLLGLLVQSPSLTERIAQGKTVGYVIIVLGIFGVLIAIWRVLVLWTVSGKVRRQMRNIKKPGDNPLGRVLKIYENSTDADVETMELKLGEAILRETPKFNSMLPLLKIISVVAPLLGLLGTVTGMIVTFQAITLYGAGDPKLMAGGISTALVTTVLGLVVAIPTVFLHTLVSSRARRLTQILQEEAAGMLAERAEEGRTNA